MEQEDVRSTRDLSAAGVWDGCDVIENRSGEQASCSSQRLSNVLLRKWESITHKPIGHTQGLYSLVLF